jgi:uncharacterized SAM-binding protein YcdF (DUF218 family)
VSFRYLIWSFLSPSQLILAGVLVGALLLAAGRSRAGGWLTIAAGMALLVFGLLPTAIYIANPLETRFPTPELPERVDGILLLAGSERPTASEVYGEPQLGAAGGRYISTLRLANRYPEARIVYTGGPIERKGKGVLETQPAVAAAILSSVGLDAARISFEQQSSDTCTSARNSHSHVRPRPEDRWVVVTSASHMPRTVACFRAAGWDVIPYPADFQSVRGGWNAGSFQIADNLVLLDLAMHEWIGLAYYRLTGRTREFFPAP